MKKKPRFDDYAITIKTDPSYFGSEASQEDAQGISQLIAERLSASFPGINIRFSAAIGAGAQDRTDGPSEILIGRIDAAAEAILPEASQAWVASKGAALIGRLGGLSRSRVKIAAAKANGAKGGRPRKKA